MIAHLQMITIYVSDLARALDFYTRLLGFEQTAEFDDGETHLVWVCPKAAMESDLATEIALQPLPSGDPRVGSLAGVVFSSEDVAETYHQLKAKGVEFELNLVTHGYGREGGDQECRFRDPDGNLIVLHT